MTTAEAEIASNTGVHDQVMSLPELIRTQVPLLADLTRKIVPTPVVHSFRQILITGCGDSAIAGQAVELSFRRLLGIPVQAANAMTISRYVLPGYAGQYPNTPAVLAISHSGAVARVVEAAEHGTAAGGYVLALTANAGSALAVHAAASVDTGIPKVGSGPGVRSYVIAILALQLLAIRWAEVRGRITMDQAGARRKELAGVADLVESGLTAADVAARQVSQQWLDAGVDAIDYLGAGPDRASAAYGAAKTLEATGLHAGDTDLEEFVHLQYFNRRPATTAAVLIASGSAPSASRATEVAGQLTALGRPWVSLGGVVADVPCLASWEFRRPEHDPILAVPGLALLASHLMTGLGEKPGRGQVGPWAGSVGGRITRESVMEPFASTGDLG